MRSWLVIVSCLAACRESSRAPVEHEPPVVAPPMPALPDVPAPAIVQDASRELGQGITVREVQVDRGGVPMTLWIYRRGAREVKRPVLLIAPAGSPLVWGMNLTDDDRAEHTPWAERGYLVVAYSLDGALQGEETRESMSAAVKAFTAARAGLDNYLAALAFARAHESPDLQRIVVAGHSSAGSVALGIAAKDPRVSAVVAFAPGVSVLAPLEAVAYQADVTPEMTDVLRQSSPLSNMSVLRSRPMFLFHASDDTAVPRTEIDLLLPAVEGPSKFVSVPSGGHYDAMLAKGIPAAADWLAKRGLAP